MELADEDLRSVQEVRNLLEKAEKSQKVLKAFGQEKIDRIVKAIADTGYQEAEELAKIACEETGYGIWQDKKIKNQFGSKALYESIKNQKVIGILKEDYKKKIIEIGVPVGVIAGILPSTNPTSTAMYKTLISIKSGNSIVFSPHPAAKECTVETVRILAEAAEKEGCPQGAISCISIPTVQATKELMENQKTKLILATGGNAMVKSAYSSGTPAIGVGSGNSPAFLDKSCDLPNAVKHILDSKTFDHGVICCSEQSIICESGMKEKVIKEFEKQGGYFLKKYEKQKLERLLQDGEKMNPQIVGKSVETIAEMAGLSSIPPETRILIADESKVGKDVPFSREKLAPLLAFYIEETQQKVLKRIQQLFELEGAGHTCCIHSRDEEIIKEFAKNIPASRILVNTPGAFGGIGAATELPPALTLGCGAVGGSSSSDNIGIMHLINIRRVAYGTKDVEELFN